VKWARKLFARKYEVYMDSPALNDNAIERFRTYLHAREYANDMNWHAYIIDPDDSAKPYQIYKARLRRF
jgi:hypothetical protein